MGKTKVQKIGFLVGIVAMLVIGFMPTPEGLSLVGQRVLAVTVLMGYCSNCNNTNNLFLIRFFLCWFIRI